MTGADLTGLLVEAVHAAERQAPELDPMASLAQARRSGRQRREHLAMLAFVLFVVLLQLLPAEALGAPTQVTDMAVSAEPVAGAPAPGPPGV